MDNQYKYLLFSFFISASSIISCTSADPNFNTSVAASGNNETNNGIDKGSDSSIDGSQSFVSAGSFSASESKIIDKYGTQRTFSAYRRILATNTGAQSTTITVKPFSNLDFQALDEVVLYIAGAGEANSLCRGVVGNYSYAKVLQTSPSDGIIEISGSYTVVVPNADLPSNSSGSNFCFVEVVRVPHLKNLTISAGAELKAPNFDYSLNPITGGGGGILALKVVGTLTLDGVISANSSGYQGGKFNGESLNPRLSQGDGYGGLGDFISSAANTNGGGALFSASDYGGGGGGNAGTGGNGDIPNGGGKPNFLCGSNQLCSPQPIDLGGNARVFMGGGGGGGFITDTDNVQNNSYGGNGGGIVLIEAGAITSTGSFGKITALGGDAASNAGAGAGGSVVIKALKLDGQNQLWGADGGRNLGTFTNHQLFGGGGGYVSVQYCPAKGTLPSALGVAGAPPPSMVESSSTAIARGGKVEIEANICPKPEVKEITATFIGSTRPYVGCSTTTKYVTTATMQLDSDLPVDATILLAQMSIEGLKINEWKDLTTYLNIKVSPLSVESFGTVTPWQSSYSEQILSNTLRWNVGAPNVSPDFKNSFNTLRPNGNEALAVGSKFRIHIASSVEDCTILGETNKLYYNTTVNKPKLRILFTNKTQ